MRALAGLLPFILLALLAGIGQAFAHPHIFVDSTARIVFDAEGRFAAIENRWAFDEGFSAWVTQGLDTDGDGTISPAEMQDLADENLLGLAEFQYYTFGGEGRTSLIFRPEGIGHMHMDNGQAVLEFTLAPIAPYPIRSTLEIEVTDPDYYVAFSFPENDGAVLVNPPLGCGVAATPPKPLSDDDARLLANIGMDQVTLPPELRALVRDQTNIITVNCVAGASATPETPATALDAIDTLTRPVSLPFGGPPVELGIPMPRTGFLGWVNEQQKTFYKALSGALTALKSDGNAFFVLGLLSFLYGVFHSAGPGHGKVVISSYMLAGERQLRTGIALSFAAALAQSLTAIIFIVVAAAILRMSSVAMNGVAGSIETLSYALIVLLGIWLLVRRFLGHGHDHGHDDHHDHGHDHHHAHEGHTHHHVVVPQKGQNLREALGMVLAVGLRPCSGALIVLVFALSQGVLLAGIVSVLLMGLGTALTVSVLASLAVGAKALALRIGSRTESARTVVTIIELAGAILLIFFGGVMLLASLAG